jgi:ABC-type dipeptide/oligopeptide/nickel transport system permease subunit
MVVSGERDLLQARASIRKELALQTSDSQTRRQPPGTILLLGMLGFLLAAILLGPLLWPASATAQDAASRLQGPSLTHPLGTDQYGRDTLARVLMGGRWTLLGAGIVSLGVTLAGLVLAACAAVGHRWLDAVISRTIDACLAIPNLVIALAVVAVLGPGFQHLMLALIVAGWPWYARAYRAAILRERSSTYVEGAMVVGASRTRIVLRHIGPNVAGQVLVLATTNLGFVILNLAALSFIGLGIQPPTPEWGAMISEARPFFQTHPVQMIVPGLFIVGTVIFINLAGDALRDHLDPRLRNR